MHASTICADPLTVEGKYQVKIPTPFVPGSEASGTVVEVGSKDSSFQPGDRVSRQHLTRNMCDERIALCSCNHVCFVCGR